MATKTAKSTKIPRDATIQLKTTPTEKNDLQKLADRYFGGNLSKMARFTMFNWDFKKNPPPTM